METTTQNARDTLEVRYGRFRLVLLYLGAVAFVAIGYWMRVAEMSDWMMLRYGWVFPWFPWFCMIFFGLCAVLWGRAIFDRRPQLVVGPRGILWRKWSASEIPWTEVTEIEVNRILLSEFLCIFVRDRKRVPGSGLEKFAAPINRLLRNGDISIPLYSLDKPKEAIMAAIGRNFKGSS